MGSDYLVYVLPLEVMKGPVREYCKQCMMPMLHTMDSLHGICCAQKTQGSPNRRHNFQNNIRSPNRRHNF